MTRIADQVNRSKWFYWDTGIGGNLYVYCRYKKPLEDACFWIKKSKNSIYWNERHKCYVIRIKQKRHKEAFDYYVNKFIKT